MPVTASVKPRHRLLKRSLSDMSGRFNVFGLFSVAGLCLVFLSSCSQHMDYSTSPHFNSQTGRFEHPDGDKHDKGFFDLIGLAGEYFSRPPDEVEDTGLPVITSTSEQLQDFSESVIWIGQSSLLLNHQGMTVLTDPHFTDRASPFSFIGPKRVTPAPFDIASLPDIDVVLISHNHYDHLDEQSIRELAATQPDIQFLVPLGLETLLREWGAEQVTELDWYQPVQIDSTTIQATPVQHWSRRATFDRNKTLWAGWMVTWSDFSFYFAGDTGYSDDFRQTAERLGSPTLAAIPIGAYEPREFMASAHVNPDEAARIFSDLGASYAVGIHWGTFKLTLEPMAEPPRKLAEALDKYDIPADRFRALTHGEAWTAPFDGS